MPWQPLSLPLTAPTSLSAWAPPPQPIDFRTRGDLGQRMWLAAHPEEILEVTRVYVAEGAVKACVAHACGDLVDGLPLTDRVAGCPSHGLVGCPD